jgi:hypothetical protein
LIAKFTITPSEKTSPLWRRLEEHFTARLEAKRASNDSVDKTEAETNFTRGEIAQIKAFLALGKDVATG